MSSNDGSGGLCDARRPFPPILLDACAYINKYESILISRSNIGKKKKTWLDRTINRCLENVCLDSENHVILTRNKLILSGTAIPTIPKLS